MNRLQSELHRLYLPRPAADVQGGPTTTFLIDPFDRTRAMVMEVTRPPSWELLGRVWLGVQAELDLPPPGIAVSGTDALQLWFSLVDAIPVPQAHAFLEALRVRFLPEIDVERVRLMPASDATVLGQQLHARLVPAVRQDTGNWSAFVSSDLAGVFVDTPWLDIPPGDEGQAALLRGLASIAPAAFAVASERLGREAAAVTATAIASGGFDVGGGDRTAPARRAQPTSGTDDEPRRFLLRVMNDESVPMALRIEAARALL